MCINGALEAPSSPLIAHISTFPPSHCGLAYYSSDLIKNLRGDVSKFHHLPVRVHFNDKSCLKNQSAIPLVKGDKSSYIDVANLLNTLPVYMVNLQHEFRIFGGKYGEYILHLLEHLNKPVLTTLHAIWPNFSGKRREVFMRVCEKSDGIVVLSNRGAEILVKNYHMPISKIYTLPHGVPDLPFTPPSKSKLRSKYQYDIGFVSAGLLRKEKGIEYALLALAKLKQTFSNFMYFILGEDHPRRKSSIKYRQYLSRMVEQLGLTNNVSFINRHLSLNEMTEYIWASDICLVPYLRRNQSSSGTLALFLACGRPVISTDFQYAKEVVDKRVGIITRRKDSDSLLQGIKFLITNKKTRIAMMKTAHKRTKNWRWPIVAKSYLKIFESIINGSNIKCEV